MLTGFIRDRHPCPLAARFDAEQVRRPGRVLKCLFAQLRQTYRVKMLNKRRAYLGCIHICFLLACGIESLAQQAPGDRSERFRRMSKESEERGLAEPFKGVTTDGKVVPGLFSIR